MKTSYAIAVADAHAQCNLVVSISSQHAGLEITAARTKKIQSRKGIDMPVLKCIGGFHDGLLANVPDGVFDGFEIPLPSYLSLPEPLPKKVRSQCQIQEPKEFLVYTYVVDSIVLMRGGFRKEVLFLVPKGTYGADAIISLLTK